MMMNDSAGNGIAGRDTAEQDAARRDGIEHDSRASGAAGTDATASGPAGSAPTDKASVLDTADVLLVYDGQCPACDNYCRMVRIREDIGHLVIVDAREDTPVMREITAAGLDIDEGMVLKLGGELYYGSDAIHMLALIGSPSGVFNRLNHRLFSSRRVARTLYPVMRAGRAVLLKLLRRTRVNNLDIAGNDRF